MQDVNQNNEDEAIDEDEPESQSSYGALDNEWLKARTPPTHSGAGGSKTTDQGKQAGGSNKKVGAPPAQSEGIYDAKGGDLQEIPLAAQTTMGTLEEVLGEEDQRVVDVEGSEIIADTINSVVESEGGEFHTVVGEESGELLGGVQPHDIVSQVKDQQLGCVWKLTGEASPILVQKPLTGAEGEGVQPHDIVSQLKDQQLGDVWKTDHYSVQASRCNQRGPRIHSDHGELKKHIMNYYKKLFGSEQTVDIHLDEHLWTIEQKVFVEENEILTKPLTTEELDFAMKDTKVILHQALIGFR
jgi:hypothetical protein